MFRTTKRVAIFWLRRDKPEQHQENDSSAVDTKRAQTPHSNHSRWISFLHCQVQGNTGLDCCSWCCNKPIYVWDSAGSIENANRVDRPTSTSLLISPLCTCSNWLCDKSLLSDIIMQNYNVIAFTHITDNDESCKLANDAISRNVSAFWAKDLRKMHCNWTWQGLCAYILVFKIHTFNHKHRHKTYVRTCPSGQQVAQPQSGSGCWRWYL